MVGSRPPACPRSPPRPGSPRRVEVPVFQVLCGHLSELVLSSSVPLLTVYLSPRTLPVLQCSVQMPLPDGSCSGEPSLPLNFDNMVSVFHEALGLTEMQFLHVACHPSWTKCFFSLPPSLRCLQHSGLSVKNEGGDKRITYLTFEVGGTRSRKGLCTIYHKRGQRWSQKSN